MGELDSICLFALDAMSLNTRSSFFLECILDYTSRCADTYCEEKEHTIWHVAAKTYT